MTDTPAAMIRVFHRTDAAQAILDSGFRDGHSTYLTGEMQSGVFVSDVPVDDNEGATGDDLLAVDVDEDLISDYEWVDLCGLWNAHREWCVPAEILNSLPVRLLSAEEMEEAESAGAREGLLRQTAVSERLEALGLSLEQATAKSQEDPEWTIWPAGPPWRRA